MAKLLQSARYISIIGVLSLLTASTAAFVWAVAKTVNAVAIIVTSLGQDKFISVALIETVDSLLIATALFVFAVSMYELFINKLALPEWMLAHNLYDLKEKLGGVIILVMVVKFLEHLVEWKDANETLLFAVAIAMVSAALIALGRFSGKE